MQPSDSSEALEIPLVAPSFARAAAIHQQHRGRLAALRRERLGSSAPARVDFDPLGAERVIAVLDAARSAREAFRAELRELMVRVHREGDSVARTADLVRNQLALLWMSGILVFDESLEGEVLQWIAEEHANACRRLDTSDALPRKLARAGR